MFLCLNCIDSNSLFENMERICDEKYVPTPTDVLRARVRTNGIIETHFKINDIIIRYVNVMFKEHDAQMGTAVWAPLILFLCVFQYVWCRRSEVTAEKMDLLFWWCTSCNVCCVSQWLWYDTCGEFVVLKHITCMCRHTILYPTLYFVDLNYYLFMKVYNSIS